MWNLGSLPFIPIKVYTKFHVKCSIVFTMIDKTRFISKHQSQCYSHCCDVDDCKVEILITKYRNYRIESNMNTISYSA